MIDRLRQSLVPLNVHSVGWGGFLLVTIGIWGPIAAEHFHAGPDFLAAAKLYGTYLASIGGIGAFIGLAPQIKS